MTAMELYEMNVMISRAAELRSNISAAIDRSLHSDRTAASLNPARDDHLRHSNSRGLAAPGAAEARSLTSIRDALEVLEEQLECIKTLQQQQRAEKDATLAELEESRDIFVRRLKQHRGREWKVINEALSFAGEPEPLLEEDDLPLPPYPIHLATDSAAFAKLDVPISSFGRNSSALEDSTFKHFIFTDEEVKIDQGICSPVDEDCERMDGSERRDGSMHHNDTRRPVANGCLFSGLKSRVFRFFNSRVCKTSGKIFLFLAGAAAVTYGRQRSVGSGRRIRFVGSNISTELWQKSKWEAGPPGKWSDLQDRVQKCAEREQNEIPVEEALRSPDISHGLG